MATAKPALYPLYHFDNLKQHKMNHAAVDDATTDNNGNDDNDDEHSTFEIHSDDPRKTKSPEHQPAFVGFEVSATSPGIMFVDPSSEVTTKRAEPIITLTPPPRPLSPLSCGSFPVAVTPSKEMEEEEEEEDDDEHGPTLSVTAVPSAAVLNEIPTAIPPQSEALMQQQQQDYGSPIQTDSGGNNIQDNNNNNDTNSPWKDVFSRCLTDCYCISNNYHHYPSNNNTKSSDDDDEPPEYMFNSAFDFDFSSSLRMMPQISMPAFLEDDDDNLQEMIPKLCDHMVRQPGPSKGKHEALQKLFELSNRNHVHNRIPLVCTTQWDIITPLCQVLSDSSTTHRDYRLALLILSNLTVPMENKAVILLAPQYQSQVLQVLYDGISSCCDDTARSTQKREIHLSCAILYNLSFLQDGKTILVNFRPKQQEETTTTTTQPSDINDNTLATKMKETSLLQALQAMMEYYLPYVAPGAVNIPSDQVDALLDNYVTASVERQAVRWTMGIMKNLCSNESSNILPTTTTTTTTSTMNKQQQLQQSLDAKIIGQSQLPLLALRILRHTPLKNNVLSQWKPQSLEDFCLGFLVELALREAEVEKAAGGSSSSMEENKDQPPNNNNNNNNKMMVAQALHTIPCRDYLQDLLQKEDKGIHSVRARAIVQQFDKELMHEDGEKIAYEDEGTSLASF